MNSSQFFAAIICAVVFEGGLSPIHGQVPSPAAPVPATAPTQNQIGGTARLISPSVIIRERGQETGGFASPGSRGPGSAPPTWAAVAVANGRILSEFIPKASVRKGLVALFVYPAPTGGDVIFLTSQRSAASVLKADPKLGLMLIAAATPTGTSYPEFSDPVLGQHIRWLRFPHQGFPKEYLLGVLSDDLPARLPAGAPVFNAEMQMIGMVVAGEGPTKTKLVPAGALRSFLVDR